MRKTLTSILLALAAPAAAQSVWTVDASGGGDHLEIQPALDAAGAGDTILIRTGDYPGFQVDGQEVQLVAELGATVRATGFPWGVWIHDLKKGQQVVVSGLQVHDLNLGDQPGFNDPGDSRGVVLVEDILSSPSTRASVVVRSQRHSVLNDCILRGDDVPAGDPPPPGEDALRVHDGTQRLFVYDSICTGGDGGDQGGGFGCPGGGEGGDGLSLESGATFTARVTATGGVGGMDACGNVGADGAPIAVVPPATHEDLSLSGRLSLPRLAREGETVTVRVSAPAGVNVVLIDSPRLRPDRYLGPTIGALHLDHPLAFVPLGKVPANGVLEVPWTIGSLPAGVETEVHALQAMIVQAGSRSLSNVTALVVVDDPF